MRPDFVAPEHYFYPSVDRDEVEVDGVAGVMAEAADVESFGLQVGFEELLNPCLSYAQFSQCFGG